MQAAGSSSTRASWPDPVADLVRLILRNLLRHPLRNALTALGIAVALLSFCLIRSMLDAWYSGVKVSAKNRVVTRNAVSLVFYLPLAYRSTIAQVPGVERVGYANWFGGIYKDEKIRFAQFAIDDQYLETYPELQIEPEEKEAFLRDRKGAIIGAELSELYGIEVGDTIQLKGTIFPGMWELNVRAIYRSRDPNMITRTLFFHWDYLNERNKQEIGRQPDHVGIYVIQLRHGSDPALISRAIDQHFANSFAETLTETETAFQQGFVSMSSSIILALDVISCVVLVIMLLVLSNTMLMSSRERMREYAILKALGFGTGRMAGLVLGEALSICACGLALLCAFLYPIFSLPPAAVLGELISFFPVFQLSPATVLLAVASSLAAALVAGLPPLRQVARAKVSEGLRNLG